MINKIIFIVILFLLHSCTNNKDIIRNQNIENVKQINIGDHYNKVIKIMGNYDTVLKNIQGYDTYSLVYEAPDWASDNVMITFQNNDSLVISMADGN